MHDIQSPPAQIRGDQIPIGGLALILEGNHKPFLAMRTHHQPGAADRYGDGLSTANPDHLSHARGAGKVAFQRVLLAPRANLLIAAELTNDLDPTKNLGGFSQKGTRPIQGIGHHTLDRDSRMRLAELAEQR